MFSSFVQRSKKEINCDCSDSASCRLVCRFQADSDVCVFARARWFQLFVMESFGELSYSAGYRKKHSRLYGFGVGGLLYPAQALPMWQNSVQGAKNRFLGFLLLKSYLMLAISTQPSSVTKRNIMDRMEKVVGTAYTPHQCSYGDRKLSSLGGNLQNTFCALFNLFTLN